MKEQQIEDFIRSMKNKGQDTQELTELLLNVDSEEDIKKNPIVSG